MSPVPTLPLNDKRAIPTIAFGTGTALWRKDATASVLQAINGGFNHIDTASLCGNEESVGDALRQVLGETSDIGEGGINAEQQKPGKLVKAHRLTEKPIFTFRSIGVSNFNIDQLKLIVEHAKVPPAVNQIRFHPYDYHAHALADLLDFANKHGIRIESYSGLAPITKLSGGPVDQVVEGIAKRLGPQVTPAQVLMNWIRAKGAVIVTTTSRKERIQEYLNTFKLAPLTEEDVAAIDEAGRHPPPLYNPDLDVHLHHKKLLGLLHR